MTTIAQLRQLATASSGARAENAMQQPGLPSRPRRRLLALARIVALSLMAAMGVSEALAESFPNKAVTIVVPFAAGSPTDVAARAFGEELAATLGTSVLVENRPGAAQSIAGAHVARAAADGYTLLFANLPALVPPSIQSKLPYVGIRSFAPVANVLSFGFVLVTSPTIPARNLREFIALLKADPGSYSFGSGGVASPPHVIAEMFNSQVGVKTQHVPYRGANQVLLEMSADRISYAFMPTGAMDLVRNGKLKAFGVASEKRDPDFPELPTIGEAGVSGFLARAKFVLVAPQQTPADVIAKLNAASNKVLAKPAFFAKVKSIGGVEVAAPATPPRVGSLIAEEEARWDGVVKQAGIALE